MLEAHSMVREMVEHGSMHFRISVASHRMRRVLIRHNHYHIFQSARSFPLGRLSSDNPIDPTFRLFPYGSTLSPKIPAGVANILLMGLSLKCSPSRVDLVATTGSHDARNHANHRLPSFTMPSELAHGSVLSRAHGVERCAGKLRTAFIV